jgi:hypothetical protein
MGPDMQDMLIDHKNNNNMGLSSIEGLTTIDGQEL